MLSTSFKKLGAKSIFISTRGFSAPWVILVFSISVSRDSKNLEALVSFAQITKLPEGESTSRNSRGSGKTGGQRWWGAGLRESSYEKPSSVSSEYFNDRTPLWPTSQTELPRGADLTYAFLQKPNIIDN